MTFSRCGAETTLPKNCSIYFWKFQNHSACVSLDSGFVQIEVLIPIDEVALFAPFSPSLFPELWWGFWPLAATPRILHPALPCPSVFTLLLIIALDWYLFLLRGSSKFCGSNIFLMVPRIHFHQYPKSLSLFFLFSHFLLKWTLIYNEIEVTFSTTVFCLHITALSLAYVWIFV